MRPLPFIRHDCGQKIGWTEKPWAFVTYGPPSDVADLLRRVSGQDCPRCGDSIPRDVYQMPKDWSSGFYIEHSRRSWWRPWTWLREPHRMIVDPETP